MKWNYNKENKHIYCDTCVPVAVCDSVGWAADLCSCSGVSDDVWLVGRDSVVGWAADLCSCSGVSDDVWLVGSDSIVGWAADLCSCSGVSDGVWLVGSDSVVGWAVDLCSCSGVSDREWLIGSASVVGWAVDGVAKVPDEIVFNVKTPKKTASGLAFLLDCFTLKMKTLRAFETSGTAHPLTLSHPDGMIPDYISIFLSANILSI
jgi:hypothetical protein